MNRSRESSISRDQVSTSSKTAKNHVTFDSSSKSDVYSRNRVTRYTPGMCSSHVYTNPESTNSDFFIKDCSFYKNTEDGRSMTQACHDFFLLQLFKSSIVLQGNTFSKLSYIFLIHQNVPQMSFHLRYMMVS